MRRTTILLALALALVALPAAAQKVFIDYDESVDFKALKTFTWVETGAPSLEPSDPLLHKYVKDQIIGQLEESGLTAVESGADFQITYHGEVDSQVRVDTMSYGYGYGAGWRWGGYGYRGPTTSQVRTYENGTLIIDAYEPSEKKMVWRGTGTVTLKSKPEKQTKQVDKILDKMGNKWDKILKNQGK